MNLHLALLLAYSAGLVALGLWIGRRVAGTGDFFVAGRRLGPGLIFATVLAANIGAGSTVGAAGLGYRDGLSAWWWVGSAGVGSLVLAMWVGPRIRALAAEHDLHTVGDFLEWRYGPQVRAVIAVLLWAGTLMILAGQLIALAWLLNVVVGLPKWLGCLAGGLVMTSYFAAGGLLASATVNLVQLVVLLGGFLLAIPFALSAAGGWGGLASTQASATYWTFAQGGGSGWMYLAILGPSFVVSPGLLQKAYGARSDRAVRIGIGANGLVLLAFAFVPVLLGMLAFARHPGLATRDMALPMLLMHDVPPLIGSLGLAALFSAEVSSADAALFMLATSLSRDLYKRFVNPAASDAQVLRVARGAAIAGGVLGVAFAIVLESVITALTIFYTLLSVSLFVPVVAGLYSRRPGVPEALSAIFTGVGVVLALQLLRGGRGVAGLTPPLLALLLAALAYAVVALMRRNRR
ncbi:MAG TPA: sodium:solute symporter family protein [Vicinamibacterales bacterium]|nr:sodium:solute symporter family protein [Vicinamibacterales bacterium]